MSVQNVKVLRKKRSINYQELFVQLYSLVFQKLNLDGDEKMLMSLNFCDLLMLLHFYCNNKKLGASLRANINCEIIHRALFPLLSPL